MRTKLALKWQKNNLKYIRESIQYINIPCRVDHPVKHIPEEHLRLFFFFPSFFFLNSIWTRFSISLTLFGFFSLSLSLFFFIINFSSDKREMVSRIAQSTARAHLPFVPALSFIYLFSNEPRAGWSSNQCPGLANQLHFSGNLIQFQS